MLPRVPPPLRPSFETWLDWAKWHYIQGSMMLSEFMSYLDDVERIDLRWEMLPGGMNPLNDEGRLIIGKRDFTFEHEVEVRASELGLYGRWSDPGVTTLGGSR